MEQNNIERITELNDQIEAAATELQGIDIPTCEPVAKTNNVMSGVLLGFAGLGVIESCAIAGFGVYKLVKYLKAKKAQKAAAEVVDIVEEPVEVVEE
ncbi:MAG: hypothetical protein J6Y02_16335 [Pseudobutyrivibrio sp.]|nr:hypothetical protein [Pseudobutyrivibrio sp.]